MSVADKISLSCGYCGRSIKAPPHLAGQSAPCPGCGQQVRIPDGREFDAVVAAVIETAAPIPKSVDYGFCSRCCSDVPAAAEVCRYCGAQLRGQAAKLPSHPYPGIAAALNVFLPGSGHVYQLRLTPGVLFLGAFAAMVAASVIFSPSFAIGAIVVAAVAVIDAANPIV